jgi:hypothetical protein
LHRSGGLHFLSLGFPFAAFVGVPPPAGRAACATFRFAQVCRPAGHLARVGPPPAPRISSTPAAPAGCWPNAKATLFSASPFSFPAPVDIRLTSGCRANCGPGPSNFRLAF